MEQPPDRGPVMYCAACFQTTPVAAACAGRSSRDQAPATSGPTLLDRFGSIVPEKGKKGLKFDPNNDVRIMDSWMQTRGVTPVGRVEHGLASSTVVVSNRPVWGDVSIWVDPRSVEEAMGGANLTGYVVSTPPAGQHVSRDRKNREEARCARGSRANNRAGSANGSADHDSNQPSQTNSSRANSRDCGLVQTFSGGGGGCLLPDQRLDCRGDCGGLLVVYATSWVVCVWLMWSSRAILNWLWTHTQR